MKTENLKLTVANCSIQMGDSRCGQGPVGRCRAGHVPLRQALAAVVGIGQSRVVVASVPPPRRSHFSICNSPFSFFSSIRPARFPRRASMLLLLFALVLAWPVAPAHAVDKDALRRKQDAQERARDMARQLVTGVLEVQLKQLEENGMQELPLYREIADMKKNIGNLVDKEMERAVELLVHAQHGTETERDQAFRQARQMIRDIVMRLSAERQNLMRRLKSAQLSAQVKRLIELQTKVWQATKTLPDQPPAQQEAVALGAIEDQGDVKQLFLQLVETLADVSQWGGPLGAGAADGLRILKAASVGIELDTASNMLDALRYSDAAKSQQLVLKGLQLLQEKLDDTQGLLGADRQLALSLARELIEKQQKLRDDTRKADLTLPDAERLVDRQATIRKELNKLALAIGSLPAAEPLLEQAKLAAYDATGRLFDARPQEALAEQGKVLGNLAEIAEKLAGASDAGRSDKSSTELAQQVNDLQQAKADLERIRQQQAKVDRAVAEHAAEAAKEEQSVSQALAKVDDNRDLPKAVVSRLASAEQAADVAAKALEKGSAKAADELQRQTLEAADRAIERAAAEIEAALDDATRKATGVKIGELARAAEALERASAAERDIAKAVQSAAEKEGLDAATAQKLSDQQAEIESIANKVAQGVETNARNAAESARAGAQAAARARDQLAQAAAQPGSASKPAAQRARESASSASEKLASAAAQLRQQIDKAAESLIETSTQQLAKVAPVREAVDTALSQAEAPASDHIERLAKAERAVREALVAQQRAAGRPAAADAMNLADKLRDAQAEQARADLAAQQLAEGKAASPLAMITSEQAVGEQSAKLAEAASKRPQAQASRAAGKIDSLTESLQQASRAAVRAAKASLDGNQSAADAARADAAKAIAQAIQQAAAEAADAAGTPAGKPDAAAQKQVSEATSEAAKHAGNEAPAASQSLAAAQKSSGEALQQAQSGSPSETAAAQGKTASSLQEAHAELQSAIKKLAAQRAQQMAKQAAQARRLAELAAAVDPGALAALREAQSRSEKAADDKEDSSPKASDAQSQSQKDVERAAANLNARQQRIERDKAIAEAVRDLAKNQQQAAGQIAQQSAKLLAAGSDDDQNLSSPAGINPGPGSQAPQVPDGDSRNKPPQAAKRRDAAEQLDKALHDFANAQRATGEAAEELANQTQIANPQLKEAMLLTSNLNTDTVPEATGAFGKGSQKLNPNAPGTEKGAGKGKGAGSPKGDAAGEKTGSSSPSESSSGSKSGKNGDGKNKSGAGAGREKKEGLGTGFIPNSPEETARMMAGAEAAAMAAAELGENPPKAGDNQEPGEEKSPGPGEGKAGEKPSGGGSQKKGEGAGNKNGEGGEKSEGEGEGKSQGEGKGKGGGRVNKTGAGGSSKEGQSRINEQLKQGLPEFGSEPPKPTDSRAGSAGARDASGEERALGHESWLTKLPPDLRKAIRAKAQRPPPRSYEDKLQKYFESID